MAFSPLTSHCFPAPRTLHPVVRQHAPATPQTLRLLVVHFPLPRHLHAAPWAVPHKRHQVALARRTPDRVADIAIVTVGGLLYRPTVTPCTERPIAFDPSTATPAAGGKPRRASEVAAHRPAPRAMEHGLRHGAATLPTRVLRLQGAAVSPPKLAHADGLPPTVCYRWFFPPARRRT